MQIVRKHKKRSGRKVIAEPVYAHFVQGSMNTMPNQPARAEIQLAMSDPDDENVRYDVEMSPEEAVKLGRRLVELGEKYVVELAERNKVG